MKIPFELKDQLSRLASQVVSAAVARGLEEVGKLTTEIDSRVKRGARRAEEISHGHHGHYRPGEDR